MKKLLNFVVIIMLFFSACSLNNNISQSVAEQIALEDAANNLNIQIQNLKISNSYQANFYHKEKDITYKDTWHIRVDKENNPLLFYYIDSKSGYIIAKGKFNK